MAEVRENSVIGWVLTGITAMAGLFGAVTLTDAYQALSFVVLILTAISLLIKINKQLRNKNCDE
jgi:hypothetical protein